MAALSAASFDATVRHQVFLERLKTGQAKDITPYLKAIDKAIRLRLSKSELTSFGRARLVVLLDSIGKMIDGELLKFSKQLSLDLKSLAGSEAIFEARSLTNAVANPAFEAIAPSAATARAAVFAAPLSVRGAQGGKLLTPFLKDWSKTQKDGLVNIIRQGVFEGQTNSQIVKAVRGTAPAKFNDGKLAVVNRQTSALVRTAVQHVSSIARQAVYEANSDLVKRYQWVSTLDGRTTDICQGLSGRTWKIGEGPVPPAHISCFPGDSLVLPSGGITGASKRWFDGEIIIIKTAGNRVLSCTPNHPILTRSGWVAANSVNIVGNVACCLPEHRKAAGFDVNHEDVPTAIEDIVHSFLSHVEVVSVPVPITAEDFHGDGRGSEVAVIGADCKLRNHLESKVTTQAGNLVLKCRHFGKGLLFRLSRQAHLIMSSFAPSVRFMSSAGKIGNLFGSGTSHPSELLFRPVPHMDFIFSKYSSNGAWADVEFIRDATDADSGGVFFDDVVSVERRDFSGHVYNLQTGQSVYFAQEIITHNCRSTTVPVLDERFDFLKEGATQSSATGPVDADETYFSWLKKQPTKFQNAAIGPTEAKLLRSGGLSAERFSKMKLDKNFKPLTLAEMQKLEPLAFERAGITLNPDTGLPIG